MLCICIVNVAYVPLLLLLFALPMYIALLFLHININAYLQFDDRHIVFHEG